MPNTKTKYTFDFLNMHVHHANEQYVNELRLYTDTISYDNNAEYLLFSDLYNLFGKHYIGTHNNAIETLGYVINKSDFEKLPKTNKEKILRAPNFRTFFEDHVISIKNNYSIKDAQNISLTKQNAPDAKISRYACWKLLKRWPNMIFPQLYFISPNAKLDELYKAAYKFSRIYHRNRLTKLEKIVNGIAHKKMDLQRFNSFMHKVFFYNADLEAIKSAYGISGTIFDHMGVRSLMARYNALDKSINAYNIRPSMTFDGFINVLYNELAESRIAMMNQTGRTPEQDISQKSISKISGELKKLESDFINKYAFQKIR